MSYARTPPQSIGRPRALRVEAAHALEVLKSLC